jgi:hypothetical protein
VLPAAVVVARLRLAVLPAVPLRVALQQPAVAVDAVAVAVEAVAAAAGLPSRQSVRRDVEIL